MQQNAESDIQCILVIGILGYTGTAAIIINSRLRCC